MKVVVTGNDVRVTGFHSITIERCSNLQVIGNTTQQLQWGQTLLQESNNATNTRQTHRCVQATHPVNKNKLDYNCRWASVYAYRQGWIPGGWLA
jgi:hypothetical protein